MPESSGIKKYRSLAERTRVHQGYAMLFFGACSLSLNFLVAARVWHLF